MPARRAPLSLLVTVLLLIAYASFYPFDFQWGLLTDALHGPWLRDMFRPVSDKGDVIANLLFYLPLGFVLALRVPVYWTGAKKLLVCAPIGGAVSFLLEVLQHLVPNRTSSMTDVVLNLLSCGGGVVAAFAFSRVDSSREVGAWLRHGRIAAVPAAILMLWIAMHSAPFAPKLGLYRAWMALEPLRRLDWTFDGTARWFVAYLILACVLWSELVRPRFWGLFVGVCAGSLVARILFRGHVLGLDEVLGMAVVLPLVAAYRDVPTQAVFKPAWMLLLLGTVIAALAPFDFAMPPQVFHWIPFQGFLESDTDSGMLSLIRKSFLYGGTVWIGMRAFGNLATPTIVLMAVTALSEFLQMFSPAHIAESTDPLFVMGLAMLMRLARIPGHDRPQQRN